MRPKLIVIFHNEHEWWIKTTNNMLDASDTLCYLFDLAHESKLPWVTVLRAIFLLKVQDVIVLDTKHMEVRD